MLAPWNPNRPATRMALGISAGRSAETLFHKGEPIPVGIYIFSKAPSAHKEGGAFLLLTLGSEPLAMFGVKAHPLASEERKTVQKTRPDPDFPASCHSLP